VDHSPPISINLYCSGPDCPSFPRATAPHTNGPFEPPFLTPLAWLLLFLGGERATVLSARYYLFLNAPAFPVPIPPPFFFSFASAEASGLVPMTAGYSERRGSCDYSFLPQIFGSFIKKVYRNSDMLFSFTPNLYLTRCLPFGDLYTKDRVCLLGP